MYIGIIRPFFIFFALILVISCKFSAHQADTVIPHTQLGTTSGFISLDKKWSLTASIDGKAYLRKLTEQHPTYIWQHSSKIHDLIFLTHISSTSQYAATASANELAVWNIQNGSMLGYWSISDSKIRAIAISEKSTEVIIALSNGQVSLINFNTNQARKVQLHQASINDIALSQDDELLVSASDDYKVLVWQLSNFEMIQSFTHTSRITRITISPDKRLIFSSDKNTAKVWQLKDRKIVSQLDKNRLPEVITSARFHPNQNFILTASDGQQLLLWDLTSGKLQQEWKVATNNKTKFAGAVVNSAAFFSPEQIVSESSVGNTEFWPIKY
ncbi:WD40 repeat domain-containing protein [Catenovulum maritimum]|uniref:Vps41 beta-propeller domain-containing protein n=1 Tax=Catenovulum maritimum TaxID=1513271 RepID=A0A0J8JKR1_9ALTE|nr:hypothetical protein [Catenovulum maritimum]KMT65076.1 hypothetical protein XM47_11465 [Catenovulum maritimum]